jgi:hypothetical protein
MATVPVRAPDGPLDGAVAELYRDDDATLAADIRILAPQDKPCSA